MINLKMTKTKYILLLLILYVSGQSMFGQGSRYTGSYTKSDPINYVGKSNFVIEGYEISSSSEDCIALFNCENVVIRNNKLGPSISKRGVYLYNCKNITIEDCSFENVQLGLIASTSQGVKFEHNDMKNIIGMLNGGFEIGSMVQFISVTGSGNSISYNSCENMPGSSSPEDIINIFASNGTANSPIVVKGNWIRGGGPSLTGGGINLGDYGGSYQIAEDNILVDPGQYGIAISGGNNMTLKNNKVYGKKQNFTNVGMIVTNWYEREAGASFNLSAIGNQINFIAAGGYQNSWWIPNTKIVSGLETNVFDKNLSPSILPEKIIGRARNSNNSNNNNNTPEGSIVPEPEKPDVTPPSQGGIGGEDQGKGPENTPSDEVIDSSIDVYLDNYNRICINTKNRVTRTSNVAIFDNRGNRLYTQPLVGYHTVVRKRFNRGTYDVRVKNGSHQKNAQLIIR